MRPVTRGAPTRAYTAYKQAIGDLEDRLGTYCSYCERRLPTSLAVEHVVPKSLEPRLEMSWENFLLGCTNCNSVKLAQPTNQSDFLWPDVDNTLAAFSYSAGGFVEANSNMTRPVARKANKLMKLVGLDRHEANGHPKPAGRDKRWQQRLDAWDSATRAKSLLKELKDVQAAQELVLMAAVENGFFSVWMTVFADHSGIRQALVQRFTGTATDCFDASFNIQVRRGGRI
jgi:uncharacterized protein (TIGR02646 family)